jgi:hypothetical protein
MLDTVESDHDLGIGLDIEEVRGPKMDIAGACR